MGRVGSHTPKLVMRGDDRQSRHLQNGGGRPLVHPDHPPTDEELRAIQWPEGRQWTATGLEAVGVPYDEEAYHADSKAVIRIINGIQSLVCGIRRCHVGLDEILATAHKKITALCNGHEPSGIGRFGQQRRFLMDSDTERERGYTGQIDRLKMQHSKLVRLADQAPARFHPTVEEFPDWSGYVVAAAEHGRETFDDVIGYRCVDGETEVAPIATEENADRLAHAREEFNTAIYHIDLQDAVTGLWCEVEPLTSTSDRGF